MKQQACKTASDGQISTGQGHADYTLLLQRLEQAVLEESALPKCRRVLAKKDIWERLGPQQAMQWARIAQIAGCVDLALEIYKFLTAQDPAFEAPWQAWMELLDILDRRTDLAALCRRASVQLGRDTVFSRSGSDSRPQTAAAELSRAGGSAPGLDAATAPFKQMHDRQQRVKGFMDLFFSRTDLFARQWADRQKNTSGYVPVRRPVTSQDMEDHFKGTRTYGFYLMNTDATVKCAVIDADLVSSLRNAAGRDLARARDRLRKDRAYMAARIKEGAAKFGLTPVIEFSGGKGYHFWFFMASPVPAARIRQALTGICDALARDLTCFNLEVFPKQDHLSGKGLGNLVKLPLGIHRQSGGRSFFIDCPKKEVDAQLKFLSTVTRSEPDRLAQGIQSSQTAKLIPHPEMAVLNKKYPDLFELERKCPAIGRLTAMLREHHSIGVREEKILFQTLGFLPSGKAMLHYLFATTRDYNPHLVDYKISRVKGSPLGCRRIHSLTGYDRDYCRIEPDVTGYLHPLIHLESWAGIAADRGVKSEKIENLADAVDNMKTAIVRLEKFLT